MSDQWQRKASEAAKRHLDYLAKAAAELSDPAPTLEAMDDTKGPWFAASYDGECATCDGAIWRGDLIRADGQGGYECLECQPHDDETPMAAMYSEPTEEAVTDAMPVTPTPDQFMDPGPVAPSGPVMSADEFMDPNTPDKPLNVSGQPSEPDRDSRGRYLVTDPATGDFRRFKNGKPMGWTRTTTFNKAASNNKAINDWNRRNIVIGASRLPHLVRDAQGLNHEDDKDALNRIADELEKAAGSKVAANLGTEIHKFTEYMDAGLKTWRDAELYYQEQMRLYQETLAEAGLEPIPGLIERTVVIQEFGGVCGTYDRVMLHRPSNSYVAVDVKSGKTLKYGMHEIETQLWVYAHGHNQNGVYDHHTKTWSKAGLPRVREDWGVVVHMPVQGDLAGQVVLTPADLTAGRQHAELCHAIRTQPSRKVMPWKGLEPEPWEARFSGVQSQEEASELWLAAKAEGFEGVRLNELVRLAQTALQVRG